MPNTTLNAKQLAVLKWVSGGCADGIYEGTAHRVVARALHNRGLIVVKGNGSSWVARMTDEGTRYLERDRQPAPTLAYAA
jgi:spermidine synthase